MDLAAPDVLWAGIDVGTQSVRAMIVDDAGTVVALGSASLRSRRPSGPVRQHEQDPHDWWDAVGVAAGQAFGALPGQARHTPVGAVAICSTSGTVALTDADGHALTPALMYDDARAVDDLARIHAAGHTGIQLSWALPKIAWLTRHHVRTGPAATYAAHSADVVAAALVGHRVHTDTSHALKSGYDVDAGRWNADLIDAAELDAALLPDVVRPGTVLGHVTSQAAGHTGIPAGTPVVAGMTDGCAAQIAAGALDHGDWNSVLGTTLVLKGVSTQLLTDPEGAVYSHLHPDGGWLPGGASNVGAAVLAAEFPSADPTERTRAALPRLPTATLTYPLTGRGERFPFVRPDATGFTLGRPADEDDRFAALLQGVAYVERLCLDRLAMIGADVAGTVTVTGGASRNDGWNQLRADVLGRPLHRPAIAEPAFGMAVLASARTRTVTERAAAMVTRAAVIDPRPDVYDRLSDGYHRLVDELERRGYLTAHTPLAAQPEDA